MKKFRKEFIQFISKGNILDLAIGVIIGGAFGKIVSSLVDNILMPLLGVLIGGHDFSSLSFVIGEATIKYGLFFQNIIDFFIIALCIFLFIKIVNKINTFSTKNDKKKKEAEPVSQPVSEEILLLTEIRDLLKKKK